MATTQTNDRPRLGATSPSGAAMGTPYQLERVFLGQEIAPLPRRSSLPISRRSSLPVFRRASNDGCTILKVPVRTSSLKQADATAAALVAPTTEPETDVSEEPNNNIDIYNDMADSIRSNEDYVHAVQEYRRCRLIQEALLGEQAGTACAYRNIGMVLLERGDYEGALIEFQKALSIQKAMLGRHHPEVALSHIDIGNVYFCMEDCMEEALEAYQDSFAIQILVLGREHRDTATTISQIADVLRSTGRLEDAFLAYSESFAIREALFGREDADTAESCLKLALVQLDLGKYDQAMEDCQECLHIRKEIYGPDHPKTQEAAQTLHRLAALDN